MLKIFGMTLLLATIWGTNFPISKQAIMIMGPFSFRLLAMIISCVVLFFCFYNEIKQSLTKLNKIVLFRLTLIAIPNFLLVPTLNNVALNYSSVTNATILVYTMPCFTSFMTMLIARKVDYFSVGSMLLCLAGISLILNEITISIGEIVILISAVCWALGAILSQHLKTSLTLKAGLFWQVLIATLLFTAIYPLFEADSSIGSLVNSLLNLQTLLPILYLGVIGSALVYFLWFYLIAAQSAEYASYAALLSPVITMLIVSFFLNQTPTSQQLIGFVLILLSALSVNVIKPLVQKSRG